MHAAAHAACLAEGDAAGLAAAIDDVTGRAATVMRLSAQRAAPSTATRHDKPGL